MATKKKTAVVLAKKAGLGVKHHAPRKRSTPGDITLAQLVTKARAMGAHVTVGIEETASDRVVKSLAEPLTAKRAEKLEVELKGVLEGEAATDPGPTDKSRLPSTHQIGSKVYVVFGELLVPAEVIGVGFSDSSVYYDLHTFIGPVLTRVWAGYVDRREKLTNYEQSNLVPTSAGVAGRN